MAMTTIRPSKPRFFKVIVPGLLKQIPIPPAFKNLYLEEKCSEGNVTLRTNKSSKCWAVSMKGFWFQEGWEDFARAHDLCIGDFLVFKREGGLKFHVLIFDPTACEKEYPLLDVVGSDDEKMEKVQTIEKNKKFTKNSPSSKVTGMAREVKEPPHFTVTLQPYNFKWFVLYIPTKFGRDNGLTNRSEVITLKDPIGRAWKVDLRYKPSLGIAYIRKGWLQFADSNKLKVGDYCTFKLLSRRSKKVVMEVEVSKCKKGLKASTRSSHPCFTIPMHPYHFKDHYLTTIRPSKPHFFKPFIPGSLQEISIPNAFFRRYLVGEKLDDQATLRTNRGGNQSWTVSVKGSCFKDGWEDFARAHDLCIGDFLVFKHEGGLMFHVHIFDPTACEKVYPLFDVAKDDQKMGKANTNKKKKNVGKDFLSFKGTAMVKPVEDPNFKVTMRPSHFKWWVVSIPADFGRENGLRNRREVMTLKDPKGKSWEVQLSHRCTGHAYIRSGWRAFSKANKLRVGDICTFKLVPRMYNKVVMEVSVSRSKSSV